MSFEEKNLNSEELKNVVGGAKAPEKGNDRPVIDTATIWNTEGVANAAEILNVANTVEILETANTNKAVK